MLDELLPDLRTLLELTRRVENFDATILACSIHGQSIKVTPDELDARHEMMTKASRLKAKWVCPTSCEPSKLLPCRAIPVAFPTVRSSCGSAILCVRTALQRGIETVSPLDLGLGYSATMRPRNDHETAALIDASLDALRFYGMYVAARMLFEAGVHPKLAFRILQQPEKRRISPKPTLQ